MQQNNLYTNDILLLSISQYGGNYEETDGQFILLRRTDPDLEVFDIVMRTEFGTTYNSYVLKGNEKQPSLKRQSSNFTTNLKAP